MNNLKDMPIAISMPLLVPINAFKDDWIASYPNNFYYLESKLSSYKPKNSRTEDNKTRSEITDKNESRSHPDKPKTFTSIFKAIFT